MRQAKGKLDTAEPVADCGEAEVVVRSNVRRERCVRQPASGYSVQVSCMLDGLQSRTTSQGRGRLAACAIDDRIRLAGGVPFSHCNARTGEFEVSQSHRTTGAYVALKLACSTRRQLVKM